MKILNRFFMSKPIYNFFQHLGIIISMDNYESPIPSSKLFKKNQKIWSEESILTGIDMNVDKQIYLIENVFPKYMDEYNFPVEKSDIPYNFTLDNTTFGLQPAAILHSMIRYYRPKTIIEVGSGCSTYISAKACIMNEKEGFPAELIAIEPYPNEVLVKGFPGLKKLVIAKVSEVEFDIFERLEENDILFIDSSHVSKMCSDVNYLYLEVMPRLRKGVFVQIHDIFLPYDYPLDWILRLRKFYNEQYLLHAFLCFNKMYEVILANYFINRKYSEKMSVTFPEPEGYKGIHKPSSFWVRKKC